MTDAAGGASPTPPPRESLGEPLALDSDAGFPRAPLPIQRPRADFFPTTQLTALLEDLRTLDGDTRRARFAESIMARYAQPLEIYARGSSLREIAEPAELVHGFFAHALADHAFLERFLASGMRLRRWLMNGLLRGANRLRLPRRHHRQRRRRRRRSRGRARGVGRCGRRKVWGRCEP